MVRLLLVNSETLNGRSLKRSLEVEGFSVDWIATLENARMDSCNVDYQAAVIEVSPSGSNGLELIRKLRASGFDKPMLVLLGKGELGDRVQALDMGADALAIHPVDTEEVKARLRALMRNQRVEKCEVLQFGVLSMDLLNRTVEVKAKNGGNMKLELTPREWKILECLVRNPANPVGKEILLSELKMKIGKLTNNSLQVQVTRLRKRLRVVGISVEHVKCRGYSLVHEMEKNADSKTTRETKTLTHRM